MLDLSGVSHHPSIEEVVDVLCNKTQKTDRGFFRTVQAYFVSKTASNMRAVIVTKDRGEIPVNQYALCLATSGYGKGHSVGIIENDIMKGFKETFTKVTLPLIAEKSFWVIANTRAAQNGSDPADEFEKVMKDYQRQGAFPYTFDSATPPAVKQLRHKLLLAECGSINYQVDEIGSNLSASAEVLTLFLELYDQGMVKPKLTKNTAENLRSEELDGKTPANMLLFGTPAKLLDGGPTENAFFEFLDVGYARRCLFGWGQPKHKSHNTQSPTEMYQHQTAPVNANTIHKWAAKFTKLADPAMYGWRMTTDDAVSIALITYKSACERKADAMADHEEIRKNELMHRYFKALKLAGAYAFVDQSSEIEMEHLLQAILLVEESGTSFQAILQREPPYVKLAKYIAAVTNDVTHADLDAALPFYKTGVAFRNDIHMMATAWGYKEHILLKKRFVDGIEFFSGETLTKTDTDSLKVSYGEHWAYGYSNEEQPFDQLYMMTQAPEMNWCNHHLKGGHRADENVLTGFNLVVIDVDGGVSLSAVHALMKDYKFLTYTTKRHQTEGFGDRFRLVMPTNYVLDLDQEDYREFMHSLLAWLPFETDEASEQRSKKWQSHDGGSYHYNLEGDLLDVLPFIPKTTKNEKHKEGFAALASLDNMERWFAQRMVDGSRNNLMIKYALALVDSNMGLLEVGKQVHAFNAKLSNPLTTNEIDNTIMVTVGKKFSRT